MRKYIIIISLAEGSPGLNNESEVLLMTQTELKQVTDFFGHVPSPAVIELCDKLSEYVNRQHTKHPEIPEHIFWRDVLDILTDRINRAEG